MFYSKESWVSLIIIIIIINFIGTILVIHNDHFHYKEFILLKCKDPLCLSFSFAPSNPLIQHSAATRWVPQECLWRSSHSLDLSHRAPCSCNHLLPVLLFLHWDNHFPTSAFPPQASPGPADTAFSGGAGCCGFMPLGNVHFPSESFLSMNKEMAWC